MKRSSLRLFSLGLLGGTMLLSGCTESKPAAVAKITQVMPEEEEEVKEEVKPAPVVKKPLYAYNPIGKRDPFRSYLAIEEDTKFRPVNPERRKSPLEKFTLDQLRLTAIISGTSSPMAMVEDPDNKGWTVHVGTRIGNNGGKVSAIMRDGLVITEEYRDAAGRKRTNKVNLAMPIDAINLGQ